MFLFPNHPTPSQQSAPSLFLELLHTLYLGFTSIYTDGSHKESPPSSTAAIYVDSLSISRQWKLDGAHTVVAAELFAILGALTFISESIPQRSIVIFTDSQSALHLLRSLHPASHQELVYDSHSILYALCNQGYVINFQWVPSHVGINGNEVVDKAATHAHSLPQITDYNLDKVTFSNSSRKSCYINWNNSLSLSLSTTGLGRYRQDASPQPWVRSPTRRIDTLMVRLRIGHVGLNSYLFKIKKADSPHCTWCQNIDDTVEHFLLYCPRFYSFRTKLHSRLLSLGLGRPTLPLLLSGEGVEEVLRRPVMEATFDYLRETNKLKKL